MVQWDPQIIKLYKIETDVMKVLKSQWKREVKAKISLVNQQKVVQRCKEGVKTRFVCDEEWGRKSYVDNLPIAEVKRVMKLRLCMVPLPCNQRSKEQQQGCRLCGVKSKIRMEHYFSCTRLARLRRSMNVLPTDTDKVCQGPSIVMIKEAKYLEAVSKLTI